MNVQEAGQLIDLVASAAPAQKFQPTSSIMWAAILEHIRLVDAIEAVKNLGVRVQFFAPADIAAEVKRLRSARLEHIDTVLPPEGLDPSGYLTWRRALIALLADGEGVAVDGKVFPAVNGRQVQGQPELGR